jgi:perosamine synthetase
LETPLNLQADRVIRVAQPSITDKEMRFVQECLVDNQLSCGPRNSDFERRFAAAHERKYGVTCNSGTTALMLALRCLNVGVGSRVPMPTLTMVACPNAVLSLGAEPQFVDSESETGNADWTHVGNNRSAYLAVHLYGVACDWKDVPKEKVIEDVAEGTFGSFPDGMPLGSKGALACYSTFGNKILTTGEGGLVLTDDHEVAHKLKLLRAHAFTPGDHFAHQFMAYGCRMTEIQAAIGLAQLERKDALLARRAHIASLYQQHLSGIWWLETLLRPPGSAWWVYPVLIRKGTRYTKDEVRCYLHEHGVETRSFFKPMHLQPHLKQFATGKYPVAEDLWTRGFYLGIHCDLDEADVAYTADLLGRL